MKNQHSGKKEVSKKTSNVLVLGRGRASEVLTSQIEESRKIASVTADSPSKIRFKKMEVEWLKEMKNMRHEFQAQIQLQADSYKVLYEEHKVLKFENEILQDKLLHNDRNLREENSQLKDTVEKLQESLAIGNNKLQVEIEENKEILQKELEQHRVYNKQTAEFCKDLYSLFDGSNTEIIKGMNNLLTYTVKTNYEQCDITANMQELSKAECEKLILNLQIETTQEAVRFFKGDQVVFADALQNLESVLTGVDSVDVE